jgi:hypothetical protein
MNKTLIILTALILIPFTTLAEDEVEQTAMDKLIDQYELKQQVANASAPQNLESENRRLKNQIIDLRVEKDGMGEQIAYLQATIDNMVVSEGEQPVCSSTECVPIDQVMNEKLITYVITSLGMYRLAELLDQAAPVENVEAHTKAQKIMNGVKSDLDVLGFDTSNMAEVPELDELLEQLEITQGSRLAR